MSEAESEIEAAVREHMRALVGWAERELGLLTSGFKGCTDTEVLQLCAAAGVDRLPVAYDEFMLQTGHGGVGSALFDIFPGDDVAFDSMVAAEDWPGARRIAEEIIQDEGYDLVMPGNFVVVYMRRASEIEYVPISEPDPPVWAFGENGRRPRQIADSFTSWFERRVGRAIKRRYPLRDAHFANSR